MKVIAEHLCSLMLAFLEAFHRSFLNMWRREETEKAKAGNEAEKSQVKKYKRRLLIKASINRNRAVNRQNEARLISGGRCVFYIGAINARAYHRRRRASISMQQLRPS